LLPIRSIQELPAPKILVIRFARMGDVLLLVPTLKVLRRNLPRAIISVLVGHRCAPILEMCSAVDEVIPIDRVAMRDGSKLKAIQSISRLAERVRKARFDLVLDLHSFRETNLLSWYSRASWRLGLRRANAPFLSFCFNLEPVLEDKTRHVSSVFLSVLDVLGLDRGEPDYRLDISQTDCEYGEKLLHRSYFDPEVRWVGINVGAGSLGRMWPPDRFSELAVRLIQDFMAHVVLFSGPQEGGVAKQIEAKIADPGRVVTVGPLSLRELASVVSQCHLLISNDTGPMHLGPATGVPTLGLFSLGYPEHYRPMGRFDRYLKKSSIQDIEVEEVCQNVAQMLPLT
jgi:ADP-heptose:LPS heptosyltransferase